MTETLDTEVVDDLTDNTKKYASHILSQIDNIENGTGLYVTIDTITETEIDSLFYSNDYNVDAQMRLLLISEEFKFKLEVRLETNLGDSSFDIQSLEIIISVITSDPSKYPTLHPSVQPAILSTNPTNNTSDPSIFPTNYPTMHPSYNPTTLIPTENPSSDAGELSNTGNKASLATIIIAVVSLTIFFFIVFIIIAYFYRKIKKHKEYKIRIEANVARLESNINVFQNVITPSGNKNKNVNFVEVMEVKLQENDNEREILNGRKSTEGEIEVHEIFSEEGNDVHQEINTTYCTPKN